MKIEPLSIEGAFKIIPKNISDSRGAFARLFCAEIFAQNGLNTRWIQMKASQNCEKGTVRGLHYQRPPYAEIKLVRCTRGKVFDVFVDLRKNSPSFGYACQVTLDKKMHKTGAAALCVPQLNMKVEARDSPNRIFRPRA